MRFLPLLALLSGCAGFVADAPIDCRYCETWNGPQAPLQIADNTWYVGTAGLSSVLIRTEVGFVLIDGGLPQSAALIANNIRALGFDLADVNVILVSHAHYDHAGGIAALQRASDARVLARKKQAEALRNGGPLPDDPQYGIEPSEFPSVQHIQVVNDAAALSLGGRRFQVIATPGHTPGSTSWSWDDTLDGRQLTLVYADSLTAVSADGFRFSDGAGDALRRSAARIAELDCDLLLAPHPGAVNFFGTRDVSCADYALAAIERLERRLARELSD